MIRICAILCFLFSVALVAERFDPPDEKEAPAAKARGKKKEDLDKMTSELEERLLGEENKSKKKKSSKKKNSDSKSK